MFVVNQLIFNKPENVHKNDQTMSNISSLGILQPTYIKTNDDFVARKIKKINMNMKNFKLSSFLFCRFHKEWSHCCFGINRL